MTTTVPATAGTAATTAHGRVAAWLVLLSMGGTSLAFNIQHATHTHGTAGLPVLLAVLYGTAPVAAAMGLSHIVAACRGGIAMRVIAIGVMLGAMGLSVGATAAVVAPVAPGPLSYLFPSVMDAAALVALQVILAPRSGQLVAPATTAAARGPRPATTPATSAAAAAAGTAITAAATTAVPAVAGPAADGDDSQRTPGQRGEVRRQMRGFWDAEIGSGRIPNGAELNRAAGKESDYSLGKRYAAEWRKELPQEMIREWQGESGARALAAVAAR
jgi:hypothetical protein